METALTGDLKRFEELVGPAPATMDISRPDEIRQVLARAVQHEELLDVLYALVDHDWRWIPWTPAWRMSDIFGDYELALIYDRIVLFKKHTFGVQFRHVWTARPEEATFKRWPKWQQVLRPGFTISSGEKKHRVTMAPGQGTHLKQMAGEAEGPGAVDVLGSAIALITDSPDILGGIGGALAAPRDYRIAFAHIRIWEDFFGRVASGLRSPFDAADQATRPLERGTGAQTAQADVASAGAAGGASVSGGRGGRDGGKQARDAAGSRTPSGAPEDVIVAALGGGRPMTAGDIAASSGLERARVEAALRRMRASGRLEKAERGYRLAKGAVTEGAASRARASNGVHRSQPQPQPHPQPQPQPRPPHVTAPAGVDQALADTIMAALAGVASKTAGDIAHEVMVLIEGALHRMRASGQLEGDGYAYRLIGKDRRTEAALRRIRASGQLEKVGGRLPMPFPLVAQEQRHDTAPPGGKVANGAAASEGSRGGLPQALTDTIVAVLESGDRTGMTAGAIRAALGLDRASIEAALRRMRAAGQLEKSGRGYRIGGVDTQAVNGSSKSVASNGRGSRPPRSSARHAGVG